MGLMDFLEPYATGFLEKRDEQFTAKEKFIADRNKLKDQTLADISKNKQKLIDEKTIGMHFDEIARQKEEQALLEMYEGSMNPVLFKWLKDNKYFHNDTKWEGFSKAFKENAGGSDLWYKTKVIGSDRTWEDHMVDEIKKPSKTTYHEIKDEAKNSIELGPNTAQFILDVQDQPFSLLDARSINPTAYQEYATASVGLQKAEAELTITEWDATNKDLVEGLNIDLKNQQIELNDLSIQADKYDLQTQPAKDLIDNQLKQADLVTKQIGNKTLGEKNNLIIDQLKTNIANVEQTMSFAEQSQDLNLQKLKAQVNNLVIEGQLQEIDLKTAGPINAAKLHGMQLSNIEQSIKNNTVGEHEQEILKNITMRNDILEKDIGKYDEQTQLDFAEQKKRIEKLQKDIDKQPSVTLLLHSTVRKEAKANIGAMVGAPSEQNALGTMEYNFAVMASPWIDNFRGATENETIALVNTYQSQIQTGQLLDANNMRIDPKLININNISNRIMGEKLVNKWNEDNARILNIVKNKAGDNYLNLSKEEKTGIKKVITNISRGINTKENFATLEKLGLTEADFNTFYMTKDGASRHSYYLPAMLTTIEASRRGDFDVSKDIGK